MARLKTSQFHPRHFWLLTFGLWLVFLSGVLTPFLGTPGAIQAIRLRQALDAKQLQLARSEDELLQLQEEANRLEKSPIVQRREIRQVLGYTAPDELIFDFSSESASL